MPAATDGNLPRDVAGFPAEGVYVPNTGTVANQGGTVSIDSTGQPSAPAIVTLSTGTNTAGSFIVNNGTKATYTYAVSATAPYATPTDYIVITGSASKTIK